MTTALQSRCDLLRSLQRPGDPLLLPNAWDVATPHWSVGSVTREFELWRAGLVTAPAEASSGINVRRLGAGVRGWTMPGIGNS